MAREHMITIVIPTRNRGYTLKGVLDSYYSQKHVTEIIFVDDCGSDDTEELVAQFALKYPFVETKYIRHATRKGAAAGRITGYKHALNDYILFGEDDAYLQDNYTDVLLSKIKRGDSIGIVSGRIIYLKEGESSDEALIRFGLGKKGIPPFNRIRYGWNSMAYMETDASVPMTHAIFLTKKSLLDEFGYDEFYSKGNGYREESDFQINVFCNNWRVIITKDTHCFHLHKNNVLSGGQRVNIYKQLYYNIYYTNYFYKKYYNKAKRKIGLPYPRSIALCLFSFNQFYELIIKSFFRRTYMFLKDSFR